MNGVLCRLAGPAFHTLLGHFLCSYLWITIFYNLTYTVALYALLLFYLGTHELLAPFKPLLKFALVKAVIFLSYWQGLFIAIATSAGAIATSALLLALLRGGGAHAHPMQPPHRKVLRLP